VNGGFLLIMLALFALMYFMTVRPRQQQERRRLEMLRALEVGDEVITTGGIYGEVKRLDDERVRLEVDADVEIVVARQAIAAKVPPEHDEEPVDDAAEEEPDAASGAGSAAVAEPAGEVA
jgi:preprotein translocase subunit YajC